MTRAIALLLLLALSLAGCGRESDTGTGGSISRTRTRFSGASCTDGGKTYASGEGWKCSDGCNSCSCRDGRITSTLMACLN